MSFPYLYSSERQVIDTLREKSTLITKPQRREIPVSVFRGIIIDIITFLHEHIERPAYPLLLFEQYLSVYTRIQFDEITRKDDEMAEMSKVPELGYRDVDPGEHELKRFSSFANHKLLLLARKFLQDLRDKGFHLFDYDNNS